MTSAQKPDWLTIETEYRAGKRSVNALATDHGISEGAIRKRAKKEGWVRDAAGAVRESVKAHLAGAGTNSGTNTALRTTIEQAAQSGIADMESGLANARRVLGRVAEMLEGITKPADLKTLNDANAGAIETIRRIRQLDEPDMTAQKGITVRYVG